MPNLCLKQDLEATMILKTIKGQLEARLSTYSLAGLLEHMPALSAFAMAKLHSYDRPTDDATGRWMDSAQTIEAYS